MTEPSTSTAAPGLPKLDQAIHSALRNWDGGEEAGGLLGELLLCRQARYVEGATPRQATHQVLGRALAVLQQRAPAAAELLRLRFTAKATVDHVGERLGFAGSTVFAKQAGAIHHLAAVVRELEAQARQEQQQRTAARIDGTPHAGLFGIDGLLAGLEEVVTKPEAPWVVAIEGIGGIGKTTLADQLMRRQAEGIHFGDFGWVSAKPQVLDAAGGLRPKYSPALTTQALVDGLVKQLLPNQAAVLLADPSQAMATLQDRLKRFPHLIVVDNLEAVEDLTALMPTIHRLANPSKFVLTSRQRLLGETGLHLCLVPELDLTYASALVRQEAGLRGLPELQAADDTSLAAIYATVGGNPLALLLVVGQLHVCTLDTVLADLHAAQGTSVGNLYTYIYRKSWDHLDAPARRVLLAMPFVNARGEGVEFIAAVAGLPPGAVTAALTHLHRLNLVQVGGDLHQRRYTIHSLTRTFLHQQVAHWE